MSTHLGTDRLRSLFSRIAKLTIFALAVSLVAPIPSAQSVDETVTKTFVVRDYTNALVEGAYVKVWYFDSVKGEMNSTIPIVQTNSSGLATVEVSKALSSVYYQVFPKSNDVVNAPPAYSGLSTSVAETIQIKFRQASLKVEVQNSDGNSVDATDDALISIPSNSGTSSNSSSMVLRSGAFGIALPSDMSTSSNYQIGLLQFVPFKKTNRFSWRYGLKASGAAGSQSYTVYADLGYTSSVSADSNGVYKLGYKSGNITGKIKDVNGNAIDVPVGVRGFVNFIPDFSAPINSGSLFNFNRTTSADATYFGRIEGPAGKYKVDVRFDNTTELPSFITYVWKNAAGGFSLSESGPFTTTSPHNIDLRIPSAANFKFKVLTPGSSPSALGASTNIVNSTTNVYHSGSYSSTGQFSMILPNGTYGMTVFPQSSAYSSFQVGITVSNGVASVVQGGGSLSAVGGFFELKPVAANFKFKIVSDTSTSTTISGADISVTKGTSGTGDFVTNQSYAGSDVSFYIADGTYTLKVNPGNKWPTYTQKTYPLVVTSGVPAVTGITADGNGVFPLQLKTKNLLFKIVSASDANTSLTNAWIDYCTVDSLTSPTSYTNCRGEGVDQTGVGGAELDNGLYFINVNPGSTSADARQAFKAEVAGGIVTSFKKRSDNSDVSIVSSRYALSGSLTNVSGTLKLSNGSTNVSFAQNEGIDVQLQKWNASNNNWEWVASSWRNVATFGFTVPLTPAAKYRVLARPFGMPDLATTASAEFETNGTQFSVLGGATGVGTPPISLTNLNISMQVPNFKIKMVNPIDDSLMKAGWIAVFKKETDGRQTWVDNMDMTSQAPGFAGIYLANGNYRLEINPKSGNTLIAGLARANYDLSISGGTATLSLKSTNVSIDATSQRFTIKPSRSNVSGRVVNQAGTGLGNADGKWVNINIQKWQDDRKYWDWTPNWGNVDRDGFFNMSVSDAGKYRLRIEPVGFGEATVSYSNEFTIAAGQESQFSIDFGPIKMSAPTLKVQVLGLNSSTTLQHIGIQINRSGQFLDWSGTGQLGTATISFAEAGTYELIVHPNTEQVGLGATRKTYSVTAVKGSDGLITATIANVTPASGVYSLTFSSASIKGSVYEPGTTNGVVNAQVVPVDSATSREMWEYSTNTNNTGKWSLSLPAGTYKLYARAPWGSSTFGNSDFISNITVAANGVATVTGLDPAALNIELRGPRWKGEVRTPSGVTDAVIPFASVCLYTNNLWTCTNANELGRWALSTPSGYDTTKTDSSAFSSNAILEIRDDRNREYPMLRFNGATAVFDAIGVGSNSPSIQTHRLNKANFKVQVTGGGKNVSNVWVIAETNNIGYLGGSSTNSSGIASLYIDTATVTQDIRVRVEVSGNKEFSNGYSTTTKTFTIAAVNAANGNFQGTVELDTPNFRGVLREPTVNGVSGIAVPWSWVQLFDESTGNWITGTNTDESGVFTMNIPKAASGQTKEYTVLVRPRWDSTGDSSKRQYTVIMDANGIQSNSDASKKVTIKGSTTPTTVTSINSADHFVLSLAAPNVKGTVVNPSNAGVQDSWVVPIISATGEHLWQQGMHSTRLGNFAMTLLDGSYRIEAGVPWNNSDLAKASPCSITVANGTLATAPNSGCVQSNGTLQLGLRAPNVTFTLKDGTTPIAQAWVSLSIGNWWTNASSNKDGKVSLFIDRTAILAANPGLASGTHDIRVWVDPPHGTSNLVRWDCNSGEDKPLCSRLADFNTASDYATISPFDVAMPQPNTRLRILADNTGLANSWVSLFKFETTNPGPMYWIGGANTDSTGWASFNVDTSTATANTRYKIEVNPPWDKKAEYSQKWYGNDNTGLTLAQINGETFTVGTPNLKLTILSPQATANKWGWIGLIEVDANNAWVKWIGGYGLDTAGVASITLEPNKRYRIDSHPSNGRPGARTECYIQTDGNSVVSKIGSLCNAGSTPTLASSLNSMTITLAAGNLIGTVKDPSGNAVSGAIVYINETGANDESKAQTVTTDSSGKFGFTVDTTKNWAVKIFPSGTVLAIKSVTNISFSGSSKDLGDIALGLKS